ncbi:hypothetical protein E1B28_002014 [Marasmius oreades]|uniref:Uncharacterized protein n=1 Tax=Marasmius oreades TaxID=181124 RepID=A0A9P7V4J6_9AGAR|nr:uncharacterized protein E1B28_002014 [Marasmius oreades]KAG7100240.1 hypothetical protein E1B28_002014 [Marasmius oreades]
MFPFFLFHYLFLFLFFDVSAQGPPLPSTNLTKDRSYEEKVSTARGAIDIEVTVTTDTNGTLSFYDNFLVQGLPTLYSQMAELDTITRNTTYREILQDQLPQAAAELVSSDLVRFFLYDSDSKANFQLHDNRVHGYAATKAYIAYRDDHFLTLAQQLWEFGKAYCISDEDIEAKQNAKKTSSLRTECDGKSLVGGVFLACSP